MTLKKKWIITLSVLVVISTAYAKRNDFKNLWTGQNTFTGATILSGATTQSGAQAVSGITTRTSYLINSFSGIDTLVAGIDTLDVTGVDTGWVVTCTSIDTAMFILPIAIKDRIHFTGTSSPSGNRYAWRADKTGR